MNTIETKIVRKTLDETDAAGWCMCGIDDGDGFRTIQGTDALIAELNDLDEAHVIFKKDGQRRQWARFIFDNGNHGLDVVCDHTCGNESFNLAMAKVGEYTDHLERVER